MYLYDRARSAISVPSPRHTSSSPWASLYIPPGFNRPPPHLVFFLVTRPTRALVRPVTLRILSSTVLASRLRSALNQWIASVAFLERRHWLPPPQNRLQAVLRPRQIGDLISLVTSFISDPHLYLCSQPHAA
ncbi:hypothetical protein PGTUg99_027142 [Puccinia graminis f. sp. tritici]|uniref:Uncharacterized protein n=1 Tax=Puccinia graminis f. sp. tritici TaxID=56615 RepID=A0A5B0P145_PUCGR|nr:hypothetical protein PGTUg99_027142 [Puccinia graminis f. sp. tritici]